ncbi:hypothetical protein TBLA_0A07920 [Henningerozyma blattae CBS 6284]|uniref:prephenate dehydratase n=1 Tax=Henningerozyma blattae (strain ATCC 34711 / CBS 6284 / DSM 70876 / NBRC 10599 / NRRL Y-10934 / UCD 77-7) TaxID=1071380 RepID=I2GWS9_HENB6|nr:hypothetical protein TBLA_0A07920 [Tetrapisispora blattae CBS 6284]CCH58581.1 hypothetical protein TBLA_0A07920 [Tetrapisispora blattae CBS 6284]
MEKFFNNLDLVTDHVIFLGPYGTYSHQAVMQEFDEDEEIKDGPEKRYIKLVTAKSIVECFEELETNPAVRYAVVPLENSTNGQVVFSYDILRDKVLTTKREEAGKFKNQVLPRLDVIGEQYVNISHCLLCPTVGDEGEETQTDMDRLFSQYKVIRILSHPQVWGQVTEYLNKLQLKYPEIKFEKSDTNSTSEAVFKSVEYERERAKTGGNGVLTLAIASEAASKIFNVTILEKSINDKVGNTTRFLILKKREDTLVRKTIHDKSGDKVNLLTFGIEKNEPGSLVDVLMILKKYQLNMVSVNSRPYNDPSNNDSKKWDYFFYIEFVCERDDIDWNEFYQSIDNNCITWCLWGSFPRNKRYYN